MPRQASISMKSVPFLSLMEYHHAEAVGGFFTPQEYKPNDVIVVQGRPWGVVRIVAEGDIEVRSTGGTATTIRYCGSMGELSLLDAKAVAQATVFCSSPTMTRF